MPSPETTTRRHAALKLALLDAFTAGAAGGYLAHQHRDALVSHSGTIGLVTLVLAAAYVLVRTGFRSLCRASGKLDVIFAEEFGHRDPQDRQR